MNNFDSRSMVVSTAILIILYATLLAGILTGSQVVITRFFDIDKLAQLQISIGITIAAMIFGAWLFARLFTKPLRIIAEHLKDFKEGSADINGAKGYGANAMRAVFKSLSDYITKLQEFSSQNSSHARNLEMMLDGLPHPVIGVNTDYKIIYANAAALDLLMLTEDEITKKQLSETLNLRKNDKPLIEPWIHSSGQSTINSEQHWQEIEFNSPSHKIYNFDVYARYKKNGDAEQPETIIMLHDRTLEREGEFTEVDFVAMAVHELRAPLTVIRGYIEVVQDELGERMSEEEKQFMQKLEMSGKQLSGFVSNILNTARADHNNLHVKLEERDWPTILSQALQDLSIRAQIHGKQLQAEIPKDLPTVAVDPISIVEVVSNLVDNAIKYSKDQNVIVVKTHLNTNGYIETTVQDFGVGIPANLVDKLFTKFYRSHHTNTQFGGSGLGLYISRAIVKAHHGDVWVKSEEGKGSTFGFTLQKYSDIADTLKEDKQQSDVTRGKHGWIKNHSLYRR